MGARGWRGVNEGLKRRDGQRGREGGGGGLIALFTGKIPFGSERPPVNAPSSPRFSRPPSRCRVAAVSLPSRCRLVAVSLPSPCHLLARPVGIPVGIPSPSAAANRRLLLAGLGSPRRASRSAYRFTRKPPLGFIERERLRRLGGHPRDATEGRDAAHPTRRAPLFPERGERTKSRPSANLAETFSNRSAQERTSKLRSILGGPTERYYFECRSISRIFAPPSSFGLPAPDLEVRRASSSAGRISLSPQSCHAPL
ncbi:hypothetical protein KM043_010514 [Ampulex compressa]|nr:hypothetical protein KM043_010514 [Ampulex compressa]